MKQGNIGKGKDDKDESILGRPDTNNSIDKSKQQ